MSFSDLKKEQKQYLILGVIAVVAVVVLIVFGIKVSLSSISEARLELGDLVGKIDTAEKSLSKTHREEAEFRSTIAELTTHLENIPPERNYYSWATETIYAEAQKADFEIDAINERGITTPDSVSMEQDKVKLESYSLRITAHGRYENVKRFLKGIASNHPLVRVTGIEINTGSEPDVHNVQLFIEWPFNLGYIAEAWKSITPERPKPEDQTALVQASSEPTKAPGAEPPDLKKEPVPPPPRLPSDSTPVQTAPTLSEPIESDIPVAGERPGEIENNGKNENQLEVLLRQ